jgi:hypothetical protein
MGIEKSRFALYIGNRGFFPASLLAAAREEMTNKYIAQQEDEPSHVENQYVADNLTKLRPCG